MARYAIMRLQKRGMSAAAGMARHALREANVTNADPQLRAQNRILVGPKTAAGVMAEIRAKLPERRRKDAVPCLEFFIGASPEAIRTMPERDQDRYFEHALKWISKRFGGRENIVSAVVHRDETSAHMQVLIVPLLDGKLNAKSLVGNRQRMEDHQTTFAAEAGATVGLERGLKGSKAKHTTIRQFYAAIEQAGGKNALPERVAMPEALPAPGFFSSKATREAHEKREQERAAALAANGKRQAEIERLAALAVAVKGRSARTDLPTVHRSLDKVRAELDRGESQLRSLTHSVDIYERLADQEQARAAAAQREVEAAQAEALRIRRDSGIDAIRAETDAALQEYMSLRAALAGLQPAAEKSSYEGPAP
jgi:Plasmid recombination enzyme